MRMKAIYDTESAVPEAFKAEYKPNGEGKWVLQVDGDLVPGSELQSFRTKNIELMRERDQVLKPRIKIYEDIGSPDDFKHLKEISDQLDEGKLIRSGKLEEAVEKRLEKLKLEHEKELKKVAETNDNLTARLSVMTIDQEADREALKRGARPEALRDIRARVRERVKMQPDGKIVGYKDNGEVDYGKTSNGLTVAEVIEDLSTADDAKHFWLENKGMNTNPGKRSPSEGGMHTGPNPWKGGADFNLSEQMRLTKTDPKLAMRLAAEAGKKFLAPAT